MANFNPVAGLFDEIDIIGDAPKNILRELGEWGIYSLAYDGDVGCNPGFIFRGEVNYKIPLYSKIEWKINDRNVLLEKESEIYCGYVEGVGQQRAVEIAGSALSRSEIWWWLSLMQHYEEPTRLIDFSRDIRVALFFALEHFREASGNDCTGDKDLIIYCFPCRDPKHQFDPENNKSPFKPIPGGTDLNLALGWKLDRKWFEPHKENWETNYGAAKHKVKGWGWDRPFFKNPRLDAQKGMFVYPFADPDTMNRKGAESWFIESLLKGKADHFNLGPCDRRAVRLRIPGKCADALHQYLQYELGITNERIYSKRSLCR